MYSASLVVSLDLMEYYLFHSFIDLIRFNVLDSSKASGFAANEAGVSKIFFDFFLIFFIYCSIPYIQTDLPLSQDSK